VGNIYKETSEEVEESNNKILSFEEEPYRCGMRIIYDEENLKYEKEKYFDCIDGELIKKKCNDGAYNLLTDSCNKARKGFVGSFHSFATKCYDFIDCLSLKLDITQSSQDL